MKFKITIADIMINADAIRRFINMGFRVKLQAINMGHHMSVALLIIDLFGCRSAVTVGRDRRYAATLTL